MDTIFNRLNRRVSRSFSVAGPTFLMSADNTVLNSGAGGDTIATDDVSGVKHQRVKRSFGRDGTASDVGTGAEFVSAAAANQDSTVVKASAGVLYALLVTNTNAAVRYLKLYNKATGPTSADTPLFRVAVPGNTAGAGVIVPIPECGIDFSAGISLRATTGIANADMNAVAANEIVATLLYV